MKRKKLCILVMLSIFAMIFLSSCTTAGIECGLIGKWENTGEMYIFDEKYEFVFTYEIRSDDKIVVRNKITDSNKEVFADKENTYTVYVNDIENHKIKCYYYEIEYRNLTCNSVEFKIGTNWIKFTKVY